MKYSRSVIGLILVTIISSLILPLNINAGENRILWDFSCFVDDNSIAATDECYVDYNGLEIHLNTDDTLTDDGIFWNSPGTTTSDNTVVSNNRYIKYTSEASGELSITFIGDRIGASNNKPRMYIISGTDTTCMSKNNSDLYGNCTTAADANNAANLTANVVAGRTYYIWPYCYGGSNVKFTVSEVSFTEKTLPQVNGFDVVYKNGEAEIARSTIELDGYYEGDSYTYISNAYVQGVDGKVYAVGTDYDDDCDTKILNDTNGGINASLRQEIAALSANCVIEYEVSEIENIVFYSEWEDIADTSANEFNNGRYWASGGKMTTLNAVTEFYTVPETGYYQISMIGAGTNKGTEIFAGAAEANASEYYGSGNALLGFKYNNKYYGLLSSKTCYLEEGVSLAIKGFGSGNVTDSIDYVLIRHIVTAQIEGADGLSILPGGTSAAFTVTTYIADQPVWNITGLDGVTVNENGVVCAEENAEEGTALITAVFGGGAAVAYKEILLERAHIDDFDFIGTQSVNLGDSAYYSVSNVTDQFGNDITSYAQVTYSSSDGSVAAADTDSGEISAKKKGVSVISAAVNVNGEQAEKEKTITVDCFYITVNIDGDTTVADITDIVQSDNITGYSVTTADSNGNTVDSYTVDISEVEETEIVQYTAEKDAVLIYGKYSGDGSLEVIELQGVEANAPIRQKDGYRLFVWESFANMRPIELREQSVTAKFLAVESEGATVIEISPIYTYSFAESNCSRNIPLDDCFANGDYTFTITKTNSKMYDIYANGYMIGNNVNQPGVGRVISDEDLVYSAKDIFIDTGVITIEKVEIDDDELYLSGISEIKIEKSPTIVKRNRKVYIIGDSLVAQYYGKESVLVGSSITGWGQTLPFFFDNGIDVLNLANAGQWAYGLYQTAFPGIIHTANEGDYLIIEAGWNDAKKSSAAEMKQSVVEMVEICEENGIIPVLVSPNTSSQTYSSEEDVKYASVMREAANKMQDKYNNVIFVDLAKESYNYLCSIYGDDTEAIEASFNLSTAQSHYDEFGNLIKGDTLHSSYLAAMKWGEIVAQGMSDAGVDFINKEFSWSVTDKEENEIYVQVK